MSACGALTNHCRALPLHLPLPPAWPQPRGRWDYCQWREANPRQGPFIRAKSLSSHHHSPSQSLLNKSHAGMLQRLNLGNVGLWSPDWECWKGGAGGGRWITRREGGKERVSKRERERARQKRNSFCRHHDKPLFWWSRQDIIMHFICWVYDVCVIGIHAYYRYKIQSLGASNREKGLCEAPGLLRIGLFLDRLVFWRP